MASAPVRHPRASTSRWKGKARDIDSRDDGNGGTQGTLVDLQLLADSPFHSAYVVPLQLGESGRQFLVQVDTGSSDLWVTSTACSSSLCNQVGNSKYDTAASIISGQIVSLKYAEGNVQGMVVWDTLQLGGYSIDHQALIAASDVADEPLSSSFTGVLGLALPINSVIAQRLPPTETDQPDGASFSSNLFSITPVSTAPGARFLSLALERPGSDRVPSLLGIGRHPSDLVPDPSKIHYAAVPSSPHGVLFWQGSVQAITVYDNGVRKPINLPASLTGARTPTAILDSGVPLIITTTEIANGIYGAIGVGPAGDGNYYLPCTTPINMTIQLDGRIEIPIHPLDLTYYPPNDANSDMCIGAIQTPSQFPGFVLPTDIILGVPFLRNTYTVMAFDQPESDGSFPPNSADVNRVESVRPRLGLLNLTDPAIAADEFHQVRVLKQPLGNTGGPAAVVHSKGGISVGVIVLIALLGVFGLCFVLFGARWAYMKRRYARQQVAIAKLERGDGKDDSYIVTGLGYRLTPTKTVSSGSGPTEDELRQKRYSAYKRRHQMDSTYTYDSAATRVDYFGDVNLKDKGLGVTDEFGNIIKHPDTPDTLNTPQSPTRGYFDPWGDTLVDRDGRDGATLLSPPRSARRSDLSPRSLHHRSLSGGAGVDVPLLGHSRSGSDIPRDSEDIAERPMDSPSSMAGVGTSGRSRRVSGMPLSPVPTPHDDDEFQPYSDALRSPRLVPPPTAVVPLSEAVLSTSRNDSRISLQGHES